MLVCLSKESVAKEGYVQREFKRVFTMSEEKPEGTIYVIPLRLDDCVPPSKFKQWQWVDYFNPSTREKLIRSLRVRASELKIETSENKAEPVAQPKPIAPIQDFDVDLDLYRFIQIPVTAEVPYSFCIGKYPVTNAQYERFLNAPDFGDEALWKGFPKFNEDCIQVGKWGNEGWSWYQKNSKESKRIIPHSWNDENFGISNPENPVVNITWYESNAYCNWLMRHWNEVAENKANTGLRLRLIRLPLDTEWAIAAGGEIPVKRFPWDAPGKVTTNIKEIVKCANIDESNIEHTTPVNAYLRGASPHGVMDMAGNVWEWQANYSEEEVHGEKTFGQRGGSWFDGEVDARVSIRSGNSLPLGRDDYIGFRMVLSLPNGRS
jgi:formylglycine-generating enzyme required for sulfatase activity